MIVIESYQLRSTLSRDTYEWTGAVAIVDGVTWLHVRDGAKLTYLELTSTFTELWEVVRRVSTRKPSDDAQSVVVTFANHDHVTPAGQPARHEVELWVTQPINPGDDLTDLGFEAAEVWPESGWDGTAGTTWWASTVTLPDGRTVNFDGDEVR